MHAGVTIDGLRDSLPPSLTHLDVTGTGVRRKHALELRFRSRHTSGLAGLTVAYDHGDHDDDSDTFSACYSDDDDVEAPVSAAQCFWEGDVDRPATSAVNRRCRDCHEAYPPTDCVACTVCRRGVCLTCSHGPDGYWCRACGGAHTMEFLEPRAFCQVCGEPKPEISAGRGVCDGCIAATAATAATEATSD
jgi:hypothetical protein